VNIGSFHEALNMSSLWGLPVVFIIENNGYGMGTAQTRAMAELNVRKHGDSYCMASDSVDGQDVFAVRDVVNQAVLRARSERRPTLLEIRTTRFMGHSMSDAASGTYRSKEELEKNMQRDPILLLRHTMRDAKELKDEEFVKIDEDVKAQVQDAWDFADTSPEPDPAELYTHILADTTSAAPEPEAALAAVQA
jgi:pyruvate dehydrogenase E1 component alpha subunit